MTTYQAAYAKYLPLALQLPGESIRAFRGDVRLVLVNVRLGFQAVLGSPQQINWVKQHLPLISVSDLLDLPDLARALVYASGKIVTRKKSTGEIEATVHRVAALRGPFLDQAVVLAGRGKFDKNVVANIRKGHGKYDMAKMASIWLDYTRKMRQRLRIFIHSRRSKSKLYAKTANGCSNI